MAGKDKIERGFRLLFDDSTTPRDLSASLVPGSVSGGGFIFDEVEVTGVSNTVKQYLAGHPDAKISARFIFSDKATTGSFTVLMGMEGKVGTLTLRWGINGAAPTTDDPEWEGEYVLTQANVSADGGKLVIDAAWAPGSATPPAWGTVSA